MKIILDAMGGDNAPLEIIKGAALAVAEYKVKIRLVGNEDIIRNLAEENKIFLNEKYIKIIPSNSVIDMCDPALSVIRDKNDSSMAIGLKMLSSGEGDAFVSAGNTGALHAGSTLIVRRIKGIKKSAIGAILPVANPTLLIDSGANIELGNESYVQFAKMGSVYMKKMFSLDNPRVGLLNNGAERTKGSKQLQEVYELLENTPDINFIGNVEGRDVPVGACDVLVTDGFSGNILLKTLEGCGIFMVDKLKNVFLSNIATKMSALVVKKGLSQMKKDMSSSEYGGAPLLGLSKPVIKAHGSSDAIAIKNAIRQAVDFAHGGVIYDILASLTSTEPEQNPEN